MFGKLKEKLSSFVDRVAQTEISEKDVENALWDLELELLEADVALEVVDELKEKIKKKLVGQKVKIGTNKREIVEKAVKDAVLEVLTPERHIDLLEMIKSK